MVSFQRIWMPLVIDQLEFEGDGVDESCGIRRHRLAIRFRVAQLAPEQALECPRTVLFLRVVDENFFLNAVFEAGIAAF